jgi:DNA polymerase (family X)
MAKEAGLKLVIDTDAHRIEELSWMRYGVDQARRGWCEAADIANTRSWEEFQKLIAK